MSFWKKTVTHQGKDSKALTTGIKRKSVPNELEWDLIGVKQFIRSSHRQIKNMRQVCNQWTGKGSDDYSKGKSKIVYSVLKHYGVVMN